MYTYIHTDVDTLSQRLASYDWPCYWEDLKEPILPEEFRECADFHIDLAIEQIEEHIKTWTQRKGFAFLNKRSFRVLKHGVGHSSFRIRLQGLKLEEYTSEKFQPKVHMLIDLYQSDDEYNIEVHLQYTHPDFPKGIYTARVTDEYCMRSLSGSVREIFTTKFFCYQ